MDTDSERVKRLLKLYSEKIENFSKRHFVDITCFPQGRKKTLGGIYKCRVLKRHIYLCKSSCRRKCPEFLSKVYLCMELNCTSWPVCTNSNSEKEVRKRCKDLGFYDRRKKLDKVYDQFFLLFRVYRGLKIDSERTLTFLNKRKARSENGKV